MQSQPHIFSIVGPTATGKSQLALALAEKLFAHGTVESIDVISADSRQVYQGMQIGTGADLPVKFEQVQQSNLSYPFWQKKTANKLLRLHGLAMITPTTEWSVSHFQQLVKEVLAGLAHSSSVVILVGGTGLYHSQALQTDPQLQVPPNPEVRQKAVLLSLHELQQWLQTLDLTRWDQMNHSDQLNPRRLVRAIEISLAKPATVDGNGKTAAQSALKPLLEIGLTASAEFLAEQIHARVNARWQHGMREEVQKLISNFSDQDWKLPAFSATGYKEVRAFLEGQLSQEEALARWTLRETQYAKRQLTWWKKQTGIEWFDVSKDGAETAALAVALEFHLKNGYTIK
jgi:tRNA dimethylallyltransferase